MRTITESQEPGGRQGLASPAHLPRGAHPHIWTLKRTYPHSHGWEKKEAAVVDEELSLPRTRDKPVSHRLGGHLVLGVCGWLSSDTKRLPGGQLWTG